MKVTITEALSRLKLLDKRIAAKQAAIRQYIARPESLVDPLAKEGGSEEFVRRTRQSLRDLRQEKLRVRTAIFKANDTTSMTVGPRTMTIAEWLIWKREIAPLLKQELDMIVGEIRTMRQRFQRITGKSGEERTEPVVTAVTETMLSEEIDEYNQIVENLDGQLSLKNATVFVDIPDEKEN